MLEIQIVWTWARVRIQAARAEPDKGSIVQEAVFIAAMVIGTLAVVAILVAKAKDTATGVKTQ